MADEPNAGFFLDQDGFDFDLDSLAAQISIDPSPLPPQQQRESKPPGANPNDLFGSILNALDDLIRDDSEPLEESKPDEPALEEEEPENPTIHPDDDSAEYGVFDFDGLDAEDEEYLYFMQTELRLVDDSVFDFIDSIDHIEGSSDSEVIGATEEEKILATPAIIEIPTPVTLVLPPEEEHLPEPPTEPLAEPPAEPPTEASTETSAEERPERPGPTRQRSVNVLHHKRSINSVPPARPSKPSGSGSPHQQRGISPGRAEKDRETRRRSRSSLGGEKSDKNRDRSHSPPNKPDHEKQPHGHSGKTSEDSGPRENPIARSRIHSTPGRPNPFLGKKIGTRDNLSLRAAPQPNRSDQVSKINARKSYMEIGSLVMGNVLPLKTEPLIMENCKLFRIEEEDMSGIPSLSCQFYWKENYFKTKFWGEVHLNFYGVKDQTEYTIVSVNRMPTKLGYSGCKTDKRGSFLFTIPLSSVEVKKTVPVHQALLSYLNSNAFDEGTTYAFVDDLEFGYGLIQLEEKHRQNPLAFKIAVLYSVGTETALTDFFHHTEASDSFWDFVNLIGRKIELNGWKKYRGDFVCSNTTQQSYYKEYNNIEIMYHIALWMNAEQHRRLVGNDVVFFVFHDSDQPFNPMGLDGLGTVPQVFFVIQKVGTHYRTSVFTRPNIKDFAPKLFFNTSFAPQDFVKVLLTKAYNGFCTAVSCPPMNRLFEVPRREAIGDLVKNYLEHQKTRAIPKEIKDRKEIIRSLETSNATQILVTVMKARDLPSMDANGASDPFCQIKLSSQTQKTKVKYKTLAPEWNEQLMFSSYFVDGCHPLCVEVWDWNQIFAAVFMGSIHLSLKSICTTLDSPRWFPLYGESNTLEEKRGEILLRFQLVGPGKNICPACHILIGSTDSIEYTGASYHAACVKCQECSVLLNGPTRKRLKKDQSQQKRDLFFCDKHWEAHDLPLSQLDPEGGTLEYRGNFKNKNKPGPKNKSNH